MDISSLSTEELQHLTPADLQRLTLPELRQEYRRLTPSQQSAVVEFLDPAFRLTPDEERRRASAWALADPKTWRVIAASCINHVIESYGRSDLDMKGTLAAIHLAAVGCWAQDRASLLGTTAVLALRVVPRDRGRGQRSPPWPLWVQNATADLVLHEQSRSPDLRRTPLPAYNEPDIVSEAGDGTSEPIARTLAILTPLGWFGKRGAPKPTTVDDWVRARLQKSPPAATGVET